MEQIRKYHKQVILFLAFFHLVGIIGLNVDLTAEIFARLIPLNLILSTVLLFLFHKNNQDKIWIAALMIYLLGYFVEVVGVNFGFIFGSYSYGDVLGPKLFDTPLIIGVNWLMLTYMIWCMLDRFRLGQIIKITAGSMIMVLYDLLLEPSAIYYGMWKWDGSDVPVQNYIAWFVISAVMFTLLAALKIKINNKIAFGLLIIQLVFFSVLNFIIFY
jgi:putative membrane protein